ncbi:acyl-CoA thioesterase-1 [Clostridiales Family XIII bacterium PM5-7]
MMNICVFGDSVAKGVIFDEAKNKYTFLKENFVNLVQSKTTVGFKNFAKFGCTVSKGSEILKKQADNLAAYPYTILEFGGNDCDLNWAEVAQMPNIVHQAQVPIESFKAIYEQMIETTRAAGSNPILLSLPPLDAERFFHWVAKDLNKDNILTYLNNDVEYIFKWHEGYNDMIFQLAAEYSIPVIDIRSDFLNQQNYKNLLCIDGMHPNKEGHQLIARTLEKAIGSLV